LTYQDRDEWHDYWNKKKTAIEKICNTNYKCGKYLQNEPHTLNDRPNGMKVYYLPKVKSVISNKCKSKESVDWTECGFLSKLYIFMYNSLVKYYTFKYLN